jgi:uncharacterized protein (DUF983 family)
MCPQCGAHTLFAGPAEIAERCRACALDFAALERGGRLAGPITLVIAALLIALALGVDEWLRPPLWVHVAVWVPLTVGTVIYALRLFKTIGVHARYEARAK